MVKEDEAKLTITLSKKAIDTLDLLAQTSGFSSRGRTIEEAVLTIDDLRKLAKQVSDEIRIGAYRKPSGEELDRKLFFLNSFTTLFLSQISRFMSHPSRRIPPPAQISNPLSEQS